MIKKFFEWIFNFIEFLFPGLKEEKKNESPSLYAVLLCYR